MRLLDIAPFAVRENSGNTILLRWEEPRDVQRVMLRVASRQMPCDGVRVGYWKSNWPERRFAEEEVQRGTIGSLGWKPRDDWFNGEWREADILTHAEAQPSSLPLSLRKGEGEKTGKRSGKESDIVGSNAGEPLVVEFAPLAEREFPDLKDFSVRFRQTLQLRIALPAAVAPDEVELCVLTDTRVEIRALAVELACGIDEAPVWDGRVEVYNGTLEALTPPSAEDPRLLLRVATAVPTSALSFDRTIVTVRSSSGAFSFAPDDLEKDPFLWALDFEALISLTERNFRYSPELVASLKRTPCIHERIAARPEQTLQGALMALPPKRPIHFIVGCEGRRGKFGVYPSGDLFARIGYVQMVPGADTPCAWWGFCFRLRFFWDDLTPNGRFLEKGHLPMLRSTYSKGDLDITQEVFAEVLGGIDKTPAQGDDPVVALVRLTFRNRGAAPLPVRQRFQLGNSAEPNYYHFFLDKYTPEPLAIEEDRILARTESGEHLRMLVSPESEGSLRVEEGSNLIYETQLPARGERQLVLKVPFGAPQGDEEIEQLHGMNFTQGWDRVRRFWEDRIAAGTQLRTNVIDIDDFWRAHLTHILINDDQEPGSRRLMGRVSSFNYGNYSNESIMQITDLDRRGYHDEARRHLETYLRYQGTVGLPGNFASKEGIFYGSGGYEMGEYNQNHGWVLWGMAEHYRLTGDRAWLLSIADQLIAGCEWVFRERRATMTTGAQGRRALEWGFLPAGTLEDVRDYQYWLSTNALTWRGLQAAADTLAEAGHPQGERLVAEARQFGDDLRAGFEEMRARTPLMRLRDGSYVPVYPSRLYWRGRDFGWIREVLEGSIILTTTLLDPASRESTWILKDFEDNRYLDAPYNYALDNFEQQWFDRGGFSFQPNLLYFPPPYLYRDEIEHFLRALFNGFAACWRADIRSMTEHPLPTLADWAGDHFKSSDESMVAWWLRLMFAQEVGEDLYVGRGIPRGWLGGGQPILLERAETYFGTMSVRYESAADGKQITAWIDPLCRKPPRRVFVRFRHPQKKRLTRVLVDGQDWKDFSPEKEWAVLPTPQAPVRIDAFFET